jgi:hypothetical protein
MNIFDKLGLENKPFIVVDPPKNILRLKKPIEAVAAQQIKKTDSRAANEGNKLFQTIGAELSMVSKGAAFPTSSPSPIVKKTPTTIPKKPVVKLSSKIAMKEGDEPVVENTPMSLAIQEVDKMDAPKKEETTLVVPKPKKKITLAEKNRFAVVIGDTTLKKRIRTDVSHINLQAPSYYMNNRAIFINSINELFKPYKEELESNESDITCDNIGSSLGNFDLLLHQKLVRDYLNLYTPYRGLLLYHGLGSGKTCTSIAIAEGFKSAKDVIIMTPASLHANYTEQLKQCGDYMYKKNQYWEWIPTNGNEEMENTLSRELSLNVNYIKEKNGAWFVNVKKPTNYSTLTSKEKAALTDQINKMISSKYHFINYNGLTPSAFETLSANYTKNIFDDKIIIIDEAHNFIGRIVNKLNNLFKTKPTGKSVDQDTEEHFLFQHKKTGTSEAEDKRKTKEPSPIRYPHLSLRLYEYLLLAKNARVVLLTGTPIINYPNEIAVLFNILRGYIKSYSIPLTIETQQTVNVEMLSKTLSDELNLDYLEYEKGILTVHRNPLGFVSIRGVSDNPESPILYEGVESTNKRVPEHVRFASTLSDPQFIENIRTTLKKKGITANLDNTRVKYYKALPDKSYDFNDWFMSNMTEVKHMQEFQNRIIGLTSYFRSAQEELMPSYDPNFEPILIEMSDHQFEIYEEIREDEREVERNSRIKGALSNFTEETSKTFKIFSRMCCNFVPPVPLVRPHPSPRSSKSVAAAEEKTVAPPLTFAEREQQRLEKEEEKEAKQRAKIEKQRAKLQKAEEKERKAEEKKAEEKKAEEKKAEEKKAEEKEKKAEEKKAEEKKAEEKVVPGSKEEKKKKKQEENALKQAQRALEVEQIIAKAKAQKPALEEQESAKKKTKKTKKKSPSSPSHNKTKKAVNIEQIDPTLKMSETVLDALGAPTIREDLVGGAGSDLEEVEEEMEDFGAVSANPIQFAEIEKQVHAKVMSVNDMHEEVEAEDELNDLGDASYEEQVRALIKELDDNKHVYLGPERLAECSPKFVHMIDNIMNPANIGLHLVYSQFRTLEGIGIFALALEAHGFSQFKIKRTGLTWDTDMTDDEWARPHYALYTGTEDKKEKDIIRAIYNGDWNDIPTEIARKLRLKNHNNNVGEIIKVFMITASGSEGINLRNTRFVHIMEPYWNPVRSEQVIGRARRICSHQNLPVELRTVQVFLYLMVLSEKQQENASKSLKHDDVSIIDNKTVFTTEQTLHEISMIKKKVNDQLLMSVKSTSIDCATFSKGNAANGIRCLVYDRPDKDEIVFHPNIDDDQRGDVAHEKQTLTKRKIKWKPQVISVNGVKYIKKMGSNEIYDYNSFIKYQETMKSDNPDLSIELKLIGHWLEYGDGSGRLQLI